ncbi:MAG: RecQ family ATP-dependent DNA helicase [Elusimicrobia bacterium]|nr:RecQ family ATP-dependent DNA helicase [Elusimicrobiota bacterium]
MSLTLSKYPNNWNEIRRLVLGRDQNRCVRCGAPDHLHVHHIVPISRGGKHDPSNLIALCERCHAHAHPDMQVSIAQRYLHYSAWRLRKFLVKLRLHLNPYDTYYGLLYFGLKNFRLGQEQIINSVLQGKDTLAVLHTSGGKSLCYQLPALLKDGTTLVISPLISTMRDQVQGLTEKGIPATCINSGLTKDEKEKRLQLMKQGLFKLVYIAPERFRYSPKFVENFKEPVSFFVVDEAHCIDAWGYGFRPDYLELGKYVESFGSIRPPILAVTATASPKIRAEIVSKLKLRDPNIYVYGFNRTNISFNARTFRQKNRKFHYLLSVIRTLKGPGIIYCPTIKTIEGSKRHEYLDGLRKNLELEGIDCSVYHGKMDRLKKGDAQDQFKRGHAGNILLATKAFGMGIDVSNIRWIVFYGIPASMSDLYQGWGRAGRDGNPATGIVLYANGDEDIQFHLLDLTYPDNERMKTAWNEIKKMVGFKKDGDINKIGNDEERAVFESCLKIFSRFGYLNFKNVPNAFRVNIIREPAFEDWKATCHQINERRGREKGEIEELLKWLKSPSCRRKYLLNYFGEPYPNSLGWWERIKMWMLRWFISKKNTGAPEDRHCFPCCDTCLKGLLAIPGSLRLKK